MSSASGGLFHSPGAQNAKANHLTSKIETVQFYFEDANKEYLYKTLLERACGLPPMGWGVYCLGSKTAILRESSVYENAGKQGPSRVFIVDKDFDDLHGKTESRASLYYWRSYSVENYLVNEDALVSVVSGRTTIPPADVRARLNFRGWLQQAQRSLIEFTQACFLAQTVGMPNLNDVGRFCSFGGGIKEVPMEMFVNSTFEDARVEKARNRYSAQLHEISHDPRHLPGKYLLCSMSAHVFWVFGVKAQVSLRVFMHNLILNLDKSMIDDEFIRLIEGVMNKATCV